MSNKKIVLAGIRATGDLHLGNYLGAVKGMLQLASDHNIYQTIYMVADVHAITTPFNPQDLVQSRRSVIIDYLSVGLDPNKSIIFQQADVPEHLELAFYFSSVMSIARMSHLPTFKEKVKQYPQNATMALLNYPILMASDILIYKASSVPVGKDQEPHLEVTREIARKMNEQYDMDFPEPMSFSTSGKYVPSLTGLGKMSKSVAGSYINLSDNLDTIFTKLKKIPTDKGTGKVNIVDKKIEFISNGGDKSFGVQAIYEFIGLFIGENKQREMINLYQSSGVRYGDLKKELAEAIYQELKPIQARRIELLANSDYVDQVIIEGAEKARTIASKTLNEVKQKMGLLSNFV